MNRLLQAWGGTVVGTLIGLANAIAVTRGWDVSDSADFFLVPVIMIAAAVLADFGLSSLSVHDVARLDDDATKQAYVNLALLVAARRSVGPAAIAGASVGFVLDIGAAASVGTIIATIMTTVAISGQPLLRGLDRRAFASVGGTVATTILTGFVVLPMALFTVSIPPLAGALVGYSLAGLLTLGLLVRPVPGTVVADAALLAPRRLRWTAGHNVTNMAGRQIDTLIAGAYMPDRLFTSYSVTIRMTAPLGLIAYASNQAVARDMHRIVDGDADATGRAAKVYRWATVAAFAAAFAVAALGPWAGTVIFGDAVEIRRSYVVVIALGYVVSVAGAASGMLLAAAEHTAALLRASITALAGAVLLAGLMVATGQPRWAAPIFVTAWLVLSTTLNARLVRRHLEISSWAVGFGRVGEPLADRTPAS